MRKPRTRVTALAAALVVSTTAFGSQAFAAPQDDVLEALGNDLTAIGINNAVWMAQHIPAMMPSAGIGAGSGLSDDSGSVKAGVFFRLGFLNNFKDVGNGLELADIRTSMPNLLPWPQLGVVAGFGLGNGLELGVDAQFVPDIDIAGENMNLNVGLFSIAGTLRWRLNKAKAFLPAFVLGLGASYYFGTFEVGVGFEEAYVLTSTEGTAEGIYEFKTAPAVEWNIFQINPELRIAWDIGGIIRPYVGFGLGISFGSVSDTLKLDAKATINRLNGVAVPEQTVEYSDGVENFTTSPARFTLRPHIGIDILMGILALTIQLDLAIMGKDEVDTDFESGASSFDASNEDFLFNESGTQSNAAVVLTTALRLQF